jgi:branched-chain amino acid transport system permease protein
MVSHSTVPIVVHSPKRKYVACTSSVDPPNIAISSVARSPIAINEKLALVAVAGKNTLRFKLEAVAIGAGLMGFGGAIYAHYISYISPDVFRSLISLYVFLALTVGGTGNSFGAVLGSMVLIGLLEASRFILGLLPTSSAVQLAASREILIGIALLIVFRFAPEGFLPEGIRSHSARSRARHADPK